MLLEREAPLALLRGRVAALAAGGGGVALVLGEAGIGKTSLLRALREQSPGVEWLAGACEPLLAPPSLAPLIDLLHALPPALAAAVQAGRSAEVMAGLLQRLQRSAVPVVLAIDDAQWADGATLDLLRYLGRRLAGTRALLLLGWRNDAGAEETLRPLLAGLAAALPPRALTRVELGPLSEAAVREWAARAGRDAAELYRVTQGHPFFVSQLLDSPAGQLPAAVRDAVLARIVALPGDTREVLELVSVSPTELPLAVLEAVFDNAAAAVDEAVALGLLAQHDGQVRFRHELARKSVESALSTRQSRALHAALFDALSLRGAPAARLVHHAAAGGIGPAVLRLAPAAAHEATAGGAHRQAAELLALALQHAGVLPATERAALHIAHARACVPANRLDEALASRDQARALHEAAGDARRAALDRCELARLLWTQGRSTAGLPHAEAAYEQLARLPGTAHEQAMAAATLAQLHLHDEHPEICLQWCERALPSLRQQRDDADLSHVLGTWATATLRLRDDPEAWGSLRESGALAQRTGQPDQAVRAWLNQATMGLVHHRHAQVAQAVEEGLAWCEAHDVDLYAARLRIRLGYGLLALGRLAEAQPLLQALVATPTLLAQEAEQARHLAALLALRRGDDTVQEYWRQMLAGTRRLGVDPWYAPQLIVRAEAAWWAGDLARARQVLDGALPAVRARGEPWRTAQLLVWMRRAGLQAEVPDDERAALPEPVRLELAGRLPEAAAAWDARGCRWEALMTRLAPGAADAVLLREALDAAQAMGAEPAASLARRRLRALGAASGPRLPRRAAAAHPQGLTPREHEVLALLAEGLTNRQIGERLVRSERTVEKHVAALLAKLGVATRAEAAARAATLPWPGEGGAQI